MISVQPRLWIAHGVVALTLLVASGCAMEVSSNLGGVVVDEDASGSEDVAVDLGRSPDAPDRDAESDSSAADADLPQDADVGLEQDAADVGQPPDADDSDAPTPADPFPARYPPERVHSPITDYVLDNILDIGNRGVGLNEHVFMKVGNSMTEDTRALYCYGSGPVELGPHTELQGGLDWFLLGDAAGTDPFSRESASVLRGRTAGWAIGGTPAPVVEEMDLIAPSFSFVQYGTNDMHQGSSFESALWAFGDNMAELIELQTARGVVPILITIPPRADSAEADLWVHTYNAVIRGLAESYQIPMVDLHLALQDVSGFGLGGDGIHLNAWSDGFYRGCIHTAEASDFGNNTRNLVLLEALNRVKRAVFDGEGELEASGVAPVGVGSASDPFVVDGLPWAHRRDTRTSTNSDFDLYTGCASSANESGPEFVYRFETRERVHLRAIVFDRGAVDIDLHLLDASLSEAGCVERAHRIIEVTLEPGTWYFVLDSFVGSSGEAAAGEYLFVVTEVDAI